MVEKKGSVVMRQPGIEPGSTAWKAAMLTTIPLTLTCLEEDLRTERMASKLVLGVTSKMSLP